MLTQTRLRDVFCVIEHAYRDRGVADDVCAGLFTHAGVTLRVHGEPDWLTHGLASDEEWRIEWSKFYYGINLATAFVDTRDHKYRLTWEQLLRSWIRQVPVDRDPSDVIGRRIQNWIYAWNIFASAPHFSGFSDGFEDDLLGSLLLQVEYLREHLSPARNHRTLELYALFVAALALPDQFGETGLLAFALVALHDNLLADIRHDGVHCEQSTHYHMLVLRSFLAARENARRFGLQFPEGYDSHLERACEFAMHCHRPDGDIPALSDADTGSYADVLELAATLFSRPDFLYAATKGMQGTPPADCNVSFADGGYHIQRSGWGGGATPFENERFLMFDCGPLGEGGHGHYDLLNVEIAAGGHPLIVDPGRYTYAENSPNLRRWFKGTEAHNTVCVDGLDQTSYRRGKPKGEVAEGRFIERISAPGFDMLCGVARSSCYNAVHTRRIFFVGNEYWLIFDRLRGDRPHRFDLRYHLAPSALHHTQVEIGQGTSTVRAPGLALVFAPGYAPRVEAGWVAPHYGVKHAAPVISVAAEGATVEFITLIAPLAEGQPCPRLQTCRDRGDGSDVHCVEINGVGPQHSATDYITWSSSIEHSVLGPFRTRAAAVWLRKSADGAESSLVACKVQELKWTSSGKTLFLNSFSPAPWVTWDEHSDLIQGSRSE
jgi:heparinase II/III-like protein